MVRLLDFRGGKAGTTLHSAALHAGSDCRAVAFAPCGGLLASGGFDGSVVLSSTAGGELSVVTHIAGAHKDRVLSVGWHPWAPAFVSTGADSCAQLWAGYTAQ